MLRMVPVRQYVCIYTQDLSHDLLSLCNLACLHFFAPQSGECGCQDILQFAAPKEKLGRLPLHKFTGKDSSAQGGSGVHPWASGAWSEGGVKIESHCPHCNHAQGDWVGKAGEGLLVAVLQVSRADLQHIHELTLSWKKRVSPGQRFYPRLGEDMPAK